MIIQEITIITKNNNRGIKRNYNFELISLLFQSLEPLITQIKEIKVDITNLDLIKVEIIVNNQNNLEIMKNNIFYSKLFNALDKIFLNKDIEIKNYYYEKESIKTLRNKPNIPNDFIDNYSCTICEFGCDPQYDHKNHNKKHFYHLLFCVEHNYDISISGENLKDISRWKLEEIENNKNEVPTSYKLELAINMLKGYYWRNFAAIESISFDDYAKAIMTHTPNCEIIKLFTNLGLLDILTNIFPPKFNKVIPNNQT